MMGRKKLGQIKAEVATLLNQLPTGSPRAWLDREIGSAKEDGTRDVETLQMLCAALERAARKPKSRGRPTKR